MKTQLETKTAIQTKTCHHCGEDCLEDSVLFEQHSFCCQGCQLVFQMLTENGLSDYYNLAEKPNVKLKNKLSDDQKFAYFDHAELQTRFITFANENIIHTQFYLPKIHCTSCLWLLEKLPWLQEGIRQARVNYLKKEIFIIFDSSLISLREVAELLDKLGYPPHITSVEEDGKQTKKTKKSKNQILYKIGITGFCAGNIMLISFPEYFGYQNIDTFWKNTFGWLSLLFSLPIIGWSASSYFKSAWQSIKHRGINMDVPISLGLLALFSRSTYEVVSQTGAGYFDSLSALIFFLLIGKWLQERTFAHISFERDYKSYFPIAVTKLEDGKSEFIPIEKLQKGDEILVRNGELIPADSILKEGKAGIDFSFITGESEPVGKEIGDLVYAGGRQCGEKLRLELTKTVSQSYLTQLWNADTFQKESDKPIQNLTDKLSANFTIAVLLVAFSAGIYWFFADSSMALNAFTAVLIVACPCALALNVPFTLGNALRLLSARNLFLKNTTVVEQIAKIDHLVFDKTGTITEGNEIHYEGKPLSRQEMESILVLASNSAHPMSERIVSHFANQFPNTTLKVEEFYEKVGYGIAGWIDGRMVRIGSAKYIGIQDFESDSLKGAQSFVSFDGKVKGSFIWVQTIREGTEKMLCELQPEYEFSLLSGDKKSEVEKVASIFPTKTHAKFSQQPADKLAYVKKLQNKGAHPMMLGDGLNDAGVLKQANVGIAISEDAHQFSPASDGILLGKELHRLPKYIAFAKSSMNVVKFGYGFSIFYNLIGLSFAVQGTLEPVIAAILMPLSSISVVGFGYLATNYLGRKLK
jgi:Cu+-exporting ATPase